MKFIIRTFVAVLVLTGAAATTQISSAASTSNKIALARTSMVPVPTCAPSDPNACGMR